MNKSGSLREKVTAGCGHQVVVKLTADPDLNLAIIEDAMYLYCEPCQEKAAATRGLLCSR